MKKLMFVLVTVVASAAAMAELKVVGVDMRKLVRNHPNYEANKAYLLAKEKDCQKKLDAIKAEVEDIQEAGKVKSEELRNPMLSAAAKEKLENEMLEVQQKFMAAQQRLRSEAMRYQQEMQDDEQRFLKLTSDDLRGKIEVFSKTNDYDLVLDTGVVPFVKDTLDVTAAMLKELGVDPEKAKDPGNEGK